MSLLLFGRNSSSLMRRTKTIVHWMSRSAILPPWLRIKQLASNNQSLPLISLNQVRPSSQVSRARPFERNRSRSLARGQRFPIPINSKSSNEAKGQPAGDFNNKGVRLLDLYLTLDKSGLKDHVFFLIVNKG